MRASHIPTFLEIAEKAYTDHDRLKNEILAEREEIDPEYWGAFAEKDDELDKIYMQVIVFLAMYLEAYIWDVGATYLSEKTMQRVDKLSPQDKWYIVPQMILGKPFPIKEHHQGYLKGLFQERNRLVHHKSIDVTPYFTVEAKFEKLPIEFYNLWERLDLDHYFEIIRLLPASLKVAIEAKISSGRTID